MGDFIDPFRIEKSFRETVQHLETSTSERTQILYILRFLEEIEPLEDQADSYAAQLIEKLPTLANPLLIAGMKPKELKHLTCYLEKYKDKLNGVERLIIRLKEYEQALVMLYEWLGEHHHKEDGTGALIAQIVKAKIEYHTGEVLVPVVEQVKNEQKAESIGRLRRLRVDIIGENPVKRHELKPTFGIIGAEAGFFTEAAEASAGRLLTISRNGKEKSWKAAAMFSLSHAWHAGRSANLALAAAFYCEMLKAEEQPEYFRLNPAICLTGDIDNDGNVLSIEEHSLSLKTEAAFFSWVQVLVVPAGQLEYVQYYLEKLNSKYPNRQLAVAGVSNIQDLFYDRRLTIHYKTDVVTHSLKRIWKRRYSVVSVSLLIVLLAIIGSLIYGPVDKNPVMADFEGEMMYVKNKNGGTIYTEEVGNLVVKIAEGYHDVITFIDIDGDKTNEVLKVRVSADDQSTSALSLLEPDFRDTIWTNELAYEIPYESHPYLFPYKYAIDQMITFDIDKDGDPELIASFNHMPYFMSFIGVFDIHTGNLERFYANPGHVSYLSVFDLDKDDEAEIVAVFELKAFRMRAIVVLPHDFKTGHGRLGIRYQTSLEESIEKAIIAVPMSVVGRRITREAGELWYTGHMVITANEGDKSIFNIEYTEIEKTDIPEFPDLALSLIFDYRLNIKSIGSSDNYDIISEQLYTEGRIPFLPDARYFENFKDSLLYWDGYRFADYPTLNKKYLELIGDDSVYYKNWYFREGE